jgi:hypothetical protein
MSASVSGVVLSAFAAAWSLPELDDVPPAVSVAPPAPDPDVEECPHPVATAAQIKKSIATIGAFAGIVPAVSAASRWFRISAISQPSVKAASYTWAGASSYAFIAPGFPAPKPRFSRPKTPCIILKLSTMPQVI